VSDRGRKDEVVEDSSHSADYLDAEAVESMLAVAGAAMKAASS
jgi:hypothetical protein